MELVAEIARDINVLVLKNQTSLDTVEANLAHADAAVHAGVKDLFKVCFHLLVFERNCLLCKPDIAQAEKSNYSALKYVAAGVVAGGVIAGPVGAVVGLQAGIFEFFHHSFTDRCIRCGWVRSWWYRDGACL